MSSVLTSDNSLLSRPTIGTLEQSDQSDIDCIGTVSDYVKQAVSENTRRAYRSDLTHFLGWGGTIPATDQMVAAYLANHAGKLAIATLQRRLASITKAHAIHGHVNPVSSVLVQHTLQGIKRTHMSLQKRAKPLLVGDLLSIMATLNDRPKDLRDKGLLLVGFAGGFRRSELVAIDYEDIEWERQGMIITIRRSKTDQEGQGRKVGIPYARGKHCPVLSLQRWCEHICVETGPIFRPLTRHGVVQDSRLSADAVSLVIKDRVQPLGFDPTVFSGHSLRAGFATSAATAGVSSWKIRQQTGHASDAMLTRYIRDGELFIDNAAGALL